jgi:hypothetical protein
MRSSIEPARVCLSHAPRVALFSNDDVIARKVFEVVRAVQSSQCEWWQLRMLAISTSRIAVLSRRLTNAWASCGARGLLRSVLAEVRRDQGFAIGRRSEDGLNGKSQNRHTPLQLEAGLHMSPLSCTQAMSVVIRRNPTLVL